MSDQELRKSLTDLQYRVTQKEETEPPFKNEFWDNKKAGIYVDVVSGEPLFSSIDKFDSGTGWPSFTRPLVEENIQTRTDRKLWSTRTEVRSKGANSHLGHVFDDGPAPTGKRYCMNSAALRFVPAEDLEKSGYGQFAKLFDQSAKGSAVSTTLAEATFAGGCFWCMEPPFESLPGVKAVISGYMGGPQKNPTYEQVSAGETGHAEVVHVQFDPKVTSYQTLLDVFWQNIDPTAEDQQFVDVGRQYRSAIFYHTPEQRELAQTAKAALEQSGRFKKKIVTEITEAGTFYPAEEYHQDYYKKNPVRYKFYRFNSGRDQFLEKHWPKKQ